MRIGVAAFLLGLMLPTAAAPAANLWVELTQGDLSDDHLAPTPLTAVPGDNFLFGIMEGGDGMGHIDLDFFSVTVPSGYVLESINLDFYDSPDFAAFLGFVPGPIFPVDPGDAQPTDLMGWVHFGPAQVGLDLLPLMADTNGAFAPLPAGVYTFWGQQIDDFTEWNANFVVSEVPEPAGLGAVVLAAVLGRPGRRVSRR